MHTQNKVEGEDHGAVLIYEMILNLSTEQADAQQKQTEKTTLTLKQISSGYQDIKWKAVIKPQLHSTTFFSPESLSYPLPV